MMRDVRWTVARTMVHVVASRQHRPNLPATSCPFCVGGLEAPDPYTVKVIPNRWPPMPDERCEVALYASDHRARLATLEPDHLATLIDTWALRTDALGSRNDVDYVLIFENSGREVGAPSIIPTDRSTRSITYRIVRDDVSLPDGSRTPRPIV